MIQITQQDILAHQAVVPWPNPQQVEQDLLLCHSMVALFTDEFLKSQVAMRGGTLLHKVHLAPPSRYSEDIDLVVIGDRPENHIHKAIRRVLLDVLGKPNASLWDSVKLGVRNTVKPSRVLRMTYRVPSISMSGRTLDITVEANVTERRPHRPIENAPLVFPYRGSQIQIAVNGFDIHEMLGTKMRALFQRKRGRDLFDLYWALAKSGQNNIRPPAIIDSFLHYMHQEGTVARRSEFIAILDGNLKDNGFCTDMNSLLRSDISYDPHEAGTYVIKHLLGLLPDVGEDHTSDKRKSKTNIKPGKS